MEDNELAPAAETTEQAEEIQPADVDQAEQDQATAEEGKPNREAAKYRTQLRAAEAERDTMRGRLEAMQRAEVARVAGESLARGDELFLHLGDDLTPYLSEDGTIDAVKVGSAASALLADRPHLRKSGPRRSPASGDGGPRGSAPRPKPRMGEIFNQKER